MPWSDPSVNISHQTNVYYLRIARGVRRGGHRGLAPQWLHDSPQFNNIIASGEATLSAGNSGKLLGGRGSAPNPADGLMALP